MSFLLTTSAARVTALVWTAIACTVWLASTGTAFAQEDCAPGVDCPGVAFALGYSGDLRRNTTGGLATGTAYSQYTDATLSWHTQGLIPNASMTTNLSVMYFGGGGISGEYVGDLQALNNIEGDETLQLYEAWTEFAFGQGRSTSLRAGILDLNAEFDAPLTSSLFVNSSFGIGPDFSGSGSNGPSIWPATGFGIRAAGRLASRLEWRFGVFEGAPGTDGDRAFATFDFSSDEGALLVGELAYSSERFNKLSLGTWRYTAAFERLDADATGDTRPRSGNGGVYALFDVALGVIGDSRVDAALRIGQASADFNAVSQYAGLVVTLGQPIAGRTDDAVGLGIAHARIGAPYRRAQAFAAESAGSAETCIELTYLFTVSEHVALLPTVQFVRQPGANPALNDAWVVGLRFAFGWEKSRASVARNAMQEPGSILAAEAKD